MAKKIIQTCNTTQSYFEIRHEYSHFLLLFCFILISGVFLNVFFFITLLILELWFDFYYVMIFIYFLLLFFTLTDLLMWFFFFFYFRATVSFPISRDYYNSQNMQVWPVRVWKQWSLKTSVSSISIPELPTSGDSCEPIANNLRKERRTKTRNNVF